jgi:hypothetical protein
MLNQVNIEVSKCPTCSYYWQETGEIVGNMVIDSKKKIVAKPETYVYFHVTKDSEPFNVPSIQCPICYLGKNVEDLPIWDRKEHFRQFEKINVQPKGTPVWDAVQRKTSEKRAPSKTEKLFYQPNTQNVRGFYQDIGRNVIYRLSGLNCIKISQDRLDHVHVECIMDGRRLKIHNYQITSQMVFLNSDDVPIHTRIEGVPIKSERIGGVMSYLTIYITRNCTRLSVSLSSPITSGLYIVNSTEKKGISWWEQNGGIYLKRNYQTQIDSELSPNIPCDITQETIGPGVILDKNPPEDKMKEYFFD